MKLILLNNIPLTVLLNQLESRNKKIIIVSILSFYI